MPTHLLDQALCCYPGLSTAAVIQSAVLQGCYPVAQGAVHELPVEAATAVSRRNHGVITFPNSVEDVISDAIGAGKKSSLRRRSAGLLHELRLLSRSVSRGGQQVLQPLNNLQEEKDNPSPQRVLSPTEENLLPATYTFPHTTSSLMKSCRRGGKSRTCGIKRFRAC